MFVLDATLKPGNQSFSGAENALDEIVDVPADTRKLNEDTTVRLLLLKKINVCETKRELLDTRVIDPLLSIFKSEICHVFPTYSTTEGNMSPYFGRYIGKNEVADETEFILLPLCDGSHFNGYIINIKTKNIIFIDSLHEIKCGTRSISAKLKSDIF